MFGVCDGWVAIQTANRVTQLFQPSSTSSPRDCEQSCWPDQEARVSPSLQSHPANVPDKLSPLSWNFSLEKVSNFTRYTTDWFDEIQTKRYHVPMEFVILSPTASMLEFAILTRYGIFFDSCSFYRMFKN